MKVALSFPACHRRGGVERVLFESANFLAGRGHETTVYAAEWGDMATMDARVQRRTLTMPLRPPVVRILAFQRALRRAIQADPPHDALAAYGILAPPGAIVWAQSVHRAWLEVSQRQRSVSGRVKQWVNPIHPVILAMEKRYYGSRQYGRLIALTDGVRQDLVRFYGIPESEIAVIPNGYAPEEFNVSCALQRRDAVRQSLGYRPEDRVVVFVANELERKGFRPLLRALASIQDPRIRLLAVGRLDASSCTAEIHAAGMADRVRFTGPTEDVAAFYAAADLFALPTQYEAWGLVIVEALACGLPVVTSRLAGAAIAVREGTTGALLDNPSDAAEIARKIAPLLDAPPERERISETVSEYAWSHLLVQYEEICRECSRT